MDFLDTAESVTRTRMKLMKDTFLSTPLASEYEGHRRYQIIVYRTTMATKRISK